MKKHWTTISKAEYAIKVIHSYGDYPVNVKLYDRFGKCVFRYKDACAENDGCNEGYRRAINACYQYANEHGDNEEFLYIHNPYEMRCKNIII